jgi:homocitrate synthase NifV
MKSRVYIVDSTNRDADQASRILLPKLAKTMLNIYLDRMGIFQSEAGFPALRHEANYLNANLELVRTGVIKRTRISGWCRALPGDIEAAFANCPGIRHMNISAPVSDIMIRVKFEDRKTPDDVINMLAGSVSLAKARGAETVGVGAEDASRASLDRLVDFALAGKKAGADRFRYSDTLGLGEPLTTFERLRVIAREVNMPVELHCHNDLGMAVAVSLAGAGGAAESGCDAYINTTVNGYGERAGNCDLVSTILALKHAAGYGEHMTLDDSVDLSRAWEVANYASYAFGLPIPVNQPGVGANVFAHESGIHASGILKERASYELFSPESLGRGGHRVSECGRIITAGAYSGLKAFRHVFEKLGVSFSNDNEARRILTLVQYANLHTQKPLTDDELRFVANYPDISATLMTVSL